MTIIASELLRFRKQKIINDLQALLWILSSVAALGIILLLAVESIFWFSTAVRYAIWWTGAILGMLLLAFLSLTAFLIGREKVRQYALSTVAREIGGCAFEKQDQVLNALQIEAGMSSRTATSQSLARRFIQSIHAELRRLDPANVVSNSTSNRLRSIALIVVLFSITVSFVFSTPFREATRHWIHPRVNFPVPLPFQLMSPTGNLSLMGGDNATIEIQGIGIVPKTIFLEITSDETEAMEKLTMGDKKIFVHQIEDVFQNLHYRAYARSTRFWQPWDEISTPTYTIEVTDRPTIEDFTVTITPPDYTRMSSSVQKGNIAEIRGLKGSRVEVQLTADKELDRAFLNISSTDQPEDQTKLDMTISETDASGEFTLLDDGTVETHIFDKRNIGNLDPIQYHLLVLHDADPTLQVLEPESHTELGGDFSIPIHLHIDDDFGFSNLQIVYETEHPDNIIASQPMLPQGQQAESLSQGSIRGESREMVSVHTIDAFSKNETSQDVYYLWDVNDLNLMPEDELKFHFELYDNDTVSGPKRAISETLTARFPSLADIFARTFEEERDLKETAEEVAEDLSDIDKIVESLELELLKNEELNWEHGQMLKRSVEEMKETVTQMEEMQEKIQRIMEKSEKHGLFSPNMMDKFKRLNELLEEAITPELWESMKKLQEALGNISAEQLMEALENFRSDTAALEQQLDRFLDILERVRAEQRLEEAVTRVEHLRDRQEDIVEQLQGEENGGDLERIAEEESRNSQEFENIRDLMEDAAESMEQFARMPSQALNDLAQSPLTEETSQNLKSAANQLQQQSLPGGLKYAQMGEQNLQQLSTQLQEIRLSFQEQTVGELTAKFEKILQNTLYISKEQEQLRNDTGNLPRNSPRLREMASRQQLLRDQMTQLIESIMQLARQTFFVTPEMGKAIGKATAGMNGSLGKLEERNGRTAAQAQGKTVGALNEAALATLAAMNSMQQSGSSSGFEQFLERMQRMAGQQQGINNQTLQLALGQIAASAQEALMRRLAHEQERLKKSLEQLMQEMRGSRQAGGDLSGIAEEMEEVLKDFKRHKVDRQTVERQQRILSRMLDSQRSLRQRDLSKKRKSTVGQEIVREGPAGLPADLGQRRNLAMEALNLALKSGYSRDHQEMIRRYFNTLIESPELTNPEPARNHKQFQKSEYVEP